MSLTTTPEPKLDSGTTMTVSNLQENAPVTLPALNPGNPTMFAVTQILISILLLASNAFAIFVIIRSNLARSRPSAFIVHLIVCDSYRGLVALVTGAFTLVRGGMSPVACRSVGFFGMSSVIMGSFAVLLLLYDRLIFISSPVNYTHRMSKKFAVFLMGFNFLQGILFGVVPLNGWGAYEYSDVIAACSVYWLDSGGFPVVVVVWVHLFPLLMSALCFARIVIWMRKRICQVRMNTQIKLTWNVIRDQSFKEANLPMQLIGKTLLSILVIYYLSWLPFFFYVIILISNTPVGSAADHIYAFLATLTLLTCLVNPWLYWLPSRRFRRSVKGILPCFVGSAYTETDVASIQTTNRPRSESLFVLNNYPIGARTISTVTSF